MKRAVFTLAAILCAVPLYAFPIGIGDGRCVCHLEQMPAVQPDVPSGPELSDADQLAAEAADRLHEPPFDPNWKPGDGLWVLVCVPVVKVPWMPKPHEEEPHEQPREEPKVPGVPEPVGVGLFGLAALALARRMRRR